MMEIKAGDTVERVEGEFNGMRVGDTATAIEIDNYNGLRLREFKGTHNPENFKVISSQEEPARPAKKTVADAWEAFPNGWIQSENNDYNSLNYDEKNGWYFSDNGTFLGLVCTREQFEAYGREQEAKQEGEKWTHIDVFGNPCRILLEEADRSNCVVILRESGFYSVSTASSLKPIKPTLTKSEMLSRIEKIARGDLFGELCRSRLIDLFDTFDITD